MKLGVVAIGRNEGDRLRKCLTSVLGSTSAVVYVDSGSSDGSVPWAQSQRVETVSLDSSIPFTAARARNAGFERLLKTWPDLEFVQFVDGDCEIAASWLARAQKELEARPDAAVVCGRRRERFPGSSVYNRLCDMEWNTPVGEALACGGDAMFRVEPFLATCGYRASLIAGEEPELCQRLRTAGWKVLRIDAEMTLHDAALTSFAQWWRRSVRAGHAFAECHWLYRSDPKPMWVRESRSNWFWGLIFPAAILAVAPWTKAISLLLAIGYIFLGLRVYRGRLRRGDSSADARLYALFCVVGKFPAVVGQLRFHWNRLLSRPNTLIEYKQPGNPTVAGRYTVAYLVNRYPHVSHTFIRREILALEKQGIDIERFSIRPSAADVIDPADQAEKQRTQVLLGGGLIGLLSATTRTVLSHPLRWLRAMVKATAMGWHSDRGIPRHWVYLGEACVLVRRLRKAGCRHLHTHFGTNSAAVALLANLLGGPSYSITIHGPEEFDRPENLSLREKIEGAAFVIAVSEFGRSQVFRWCAAEHWPKIHVVRCGVDETFLMEDPAPVPDVNRLVCVGRLCEQKGQLRLLEALGQLKALGIPFEMVLAGDGSMRSAIEATIARLGLESCVRITGWLSGEEVRRAIRESRALVLPSFAEGLPVVLMEALALGRPVICTRIAGISELVDSGVHGWVVPAGSAEALALALREALESPAARLTQMGRAGAARVAILHDVKLEASKLAKLFGAPTYQVDEKYVRNHSQGSLLDEQAGIRGLVS